MDALDAIIKQSEQAIAAAEDLAALDQIRIQYLGKKGEITALMKNLGTLPPEERPQFGQLINQAKDQVETNINQRRDTLEVAQLNQQLQNETIDVTLPGINSTKGGLHPLTRSLQRLIKIFHSLGFKVIEGP
ncbi:MAG TPA: phenylalanine--tRNA ligase subunit alpha, partial [Gammaproteobacteria bacterium]|nr:phenylalanine--tRNA ligase subunit alpha [Gammaproteobacteria bacterium]